LSSGELAPSLTFPIDYEQQLATVQMTGDASTSSTQQIQQQQSSIVEETLSAAVGLFDGLQDLIELDDGS